eukprot:156282-Amphidinium_carterae.1
MGFELGYKYQYSTCVGEGAAKELHHMCKGPTMSNSWEIATKIERSEILPSESKARSPMSMLVVERGYKHDLGPSLHRSSPEISRVLCSLCGRLLADSPGRLPDRAIAQHAM